MEDEKLVLESMYLNDYTHSHGVSTITLSCAKGPLSLSVSLPHDYPTQTSLLKYSIETCWPSKNSSTTEFTNLSKQELDEINSSFEKVHQDYQGEPMIYYLVEALKDFLESHKYYVEECDDEDEEEDYTVYEYKPPPKEYVQTNSKNIYSSETPIIDRKSVFLGHVIKITNVDQIQESLDQLFRSKKVANASHNIYAYVIKCGETVFQDFNDGGERGAGSRLLHLLNLVKVSNVLVVVTRWYGGIKLGQARFRNIQNAARNTLVESGELKK